MPRQIKDRLTYPNVVATLALFVALGGTSYAAIALPRNSVGSAQIRKGAVQTTEIHDRSIRVKDISRSARTALRGARGPAGTPGPAGAPAAKYFAAVSASGALLRGNATSGGRGSSPGVYDVGFASTVSGCAFVAVPGSTDASDVGAARATVSDQGGRVGVRTFDASGAPADIPFQLVVGC